MEKPNIPWNRIVLAFYFQGCRALRITIRRRFDDVTICFGTRLNCDRVVVTQKCSGLLRFSGTMKIGRAGGGCYVCGQRWCVW